MILSIYVFLAVYCAGVYFYHVKEGENILPVLAFCILPASVIGGIAVLPALGIGELLVDDTEITFRMDESSEGWVTYDESTDGYNDPAIWYYQEQPNGQLKEFYVKEEDADVKMTEGSAKLVRQCRDYETLPKLLAFPFGDPIECSGADSVFYIPYPEEN